MPAPDQKRQDAALAAAAKDKKPTAQVKQAAAPPGTQQKIAEPTPEELLSKIRDIDSFQSLNKIKAMIVGLNGTGKTTLAAKFRRPLLLLSELQGIPAAKRANPNARTVPLYTTTDIATARRIIQLPQVHEAYDAICLDSGSDAQVLLKNFYVSQQKGGGKDGLVHKDTWGLIIDATARLIREFRDLPTHVVINFLDREQLVDGVGLVHRPDLSGKALPGNIGKYFNLVGYVYVREMDNGKMRHEVIFNAGERYMTKTMPELDDIEPPEPLVWAHKIFGEPLPDDVKQRWDAWLAMDSKESLPGDEQTTSSAEAAPAVDNPMA